VDLTAAMVEAAGSLLCVIDVESGTIRAANGAVERLTGVREQELAGRPFRDVFELPVEWPDLEDAFSRPTGAGIPMAFAAPVRTRAGDLRPVVWSAGLLTDDAEARTLVVLTGIDEPEGWAGAGLLSHLMRAATATALVGTDLGGRITFFSAGAEELLGYRAAEMIGQAIPPHILKSPDFLAAVSQWSARRETRDWNMVRKDGREVTASITVSPLTDGRGQHVGFLGVAQDVTAERRRQSLLIEALENQRLAMERLASADRAKDSLISSISHELRTPLTSISGCAELLAEGQGGQLTFQQEELVAIIRRNAKRLEALVDEILTFVARESGPHRAGEQVVDVRTVVADVRAELHQALAERGKSVVFDVPDHPTLVSADRSDLFDVLWHLLSNALKCTTAQEGIRCSLRAEGGWTHLEVADEGFGIPAAEQVQLFERFFRTSTSLHRGVAGSGLGLATVRRAVARLGGEIWVESEHLAGATFHVRLPSHVDRRRSP
jgi:PAS domain S-box-containing protein